MKIDSKNNLLKQDLNIFIPLKLDTEAQIQAQNYASAIQITKAFK